MEKTLRELQDRDYPPLHANPKVTTLPSNTAPWASTTIPPKPTIPTIPVTGYANPTPKLPPPLEPLKKTFEQKVLRLFHEAQ